MLMSQTTHNTGPLTVVLMHGAFADASSWTGVIERLQARGVQVTAPANPLRGLASDSAYLASFLNQISGPVLAVGHSYAGAVITNAATQASNVVGLVYVAAFAPDEGERLGEVESGSKDSVLSSAQVALHYPTDQGAETAVEFAVNPAHFHEAFAADLSAEQAASWPPPSAPWPRGPSPSPLGCLPGRACLPGLWWRPATRRPAAMSSVPWPGAPGRRSPR